MNAYHGKFLRINLSNREVSYRPFDEGWARAFLGGRGFGAKIMLEETEKGVDPLGEKNKLIFMTGPLAGIPVGGSSRFVVVSKSPLTGCFGESYCGGNFAPEIKKAGIDGIIIEGKSEDKVAVVIDGAHVKIQEVPELWGKETLETRRSLLARLGKKFTTVSIGPAGENLVNFANIMSDNGTAGRTGLGAVMGSKNLKIIAVRGDAKVRIAEDARLKELINQNTKIITTGWGEVLKRIGTGATMDVFSEMGILPTKNFNLGLFKNVATIHASRMIETMVVKRKACRYCPIGCRREVEIREGPFSPVIPEYGGPEYETLASFGSLCMNDNLESIAFANQLCNAYGMDTISTGVVVAFTMDCFEKGILSEKDVGFPVRWGDPNAIVRLIQMIARREGLGNLLAEGVKKASEKIGKDTFRFAAHVKGLEIPMHEPRGKKGMAISYAAAPRGANHLEGFHDTFFMSENPAPELGITKPLDPFTLLDKPKLVKKVEDLSSFQNSLILCSFTVRTIGAERNVDLIVNIVKAATGWDFSLDEALEIGARNYDLARVFSVREGISRKDDVLPEIFSYPIPEGNSKGQRILRDEMDEALTAYYACRGWTSDGAPKID